MLLGVNTFRFVDRMIGSLTVNIAEPDHAATRAASKMRSLAIAVGTEAIIWVLSVLVILFCVLLPRLLEGGQAGRRSCQCRGTRALGVRLNRLYDLCRHQHAEKPVAEGAVEFGLDGVWMVGSLVVVLQIGLLSVDLLWF